MASRRFNVCAGSCDPNGQFSRAFVVLHADCYNILDRKNWPHAWHSRTKFYINNHSTTKTNLELFFQLMRSTIFCTFTSCSSFQLTLCLDLYGSNPKSLRHFLGAKKDPPGPRGVLSSSPGRSFPRRRQGSRKKNDLLIMTSN